MPLLTSRDERAFHMTWARRITDRMLWLYTDVTGSGARFWICENHRQAYYELCKFFRLRRKA